MTWLTAAVTWACNSAIDDSGYSPAQWVLGWGLRLPYTLLDQTGRLSLHERVTRDRAFSERIAMMSAAQRSITSLRYDRALSRAVLARSRAHGADPARQLFQVGDVVYYWRDNGKAKREWAAHWHGPATVIGLQHESLFMDGTRPAAALNSLTSTISMSLCKELETSVFRCQELLSNLCQLRRHFFSQCHMETLHLRHHSCRFLQRHHFNVFQEERQRP